PRAGFQNLVRYSVFKERANNRPSQAGRADGESSLVWPGSQTFFGRQFPAAKGSMSREPGAVNPPAEIRPSAPRSTTRPVTPWERVTYEQGRRPAAQLAWGSTRITLRPSRITKGRLSACRWLRSVTRAWSMLTAP